jgi:hypothetical protein
MPVSPAPRGTPQQGAKDAMLQANLEAVVGLLKTSEAANDLLCVCRHSRLSGHLPVLVQPIVGAPVLYHHGSHAPCSLPSAAGEPR